MFTGYISLFPEALNPEWRETFTRTEIKNLDYIYTRVCAEHNYSSFELIIFHVVSVMCLSCPSPIEFRLCYSWGHISVENNTFITLSIFRYMLGLRSICFVLLDSSWWLNTWSENSKCYVFFLLLSYKPRGKNWTDSISYNISKNHLNVLFTFCFIQWPYSSICKYSLNTLHALRFPPLSHCDTDCLTNSFYYVEKTRVILSLSNTEFCKLRTEFSYIRNDQCIY